MSMQTLQVMVQLLRAVKQVVPWKVQWLVIGLCTVILFRLRHQRLLRLQISLASLPLWIGRGRFPLGVPLKCAQTACGIGWLTGLLIAVQRYPFRDLGRKQTDRR